MKWILKEKIKNVIDNNLAPLPKRIISNRNIDDYDRFINCDYEHLSDPLVFPGVEDAISVIYDYVKKSQQKTVLIVGDYDADGVISSILWRDFFKFCKLKVNVFLPDRKKHGYGLSDKSLPDIESKITPDTGLILVTDCGSNNEEEIKSLKEKYGVKVIISDHHTINSDKKSKSCDAFINWHLSDKAEETCAAGQAFIFVNGFSKKITRKLNPDCYITLAAIGIIGDVMPIIGDNRIIVKYGLSEWAISHVANDGYFNLVKNSKIFGSYLVQSEVAFKIVPQLNAAGRIRTPELAFGVLAEDSEKSKILCKELTSLNEDRKKIQKGIETKIKEGNIHDDKFGILIYGPDWNPGILGPVASKVVEKYNVPSIIFGYHNGVTKGSGRAPNGINLKQILDNCKQIFDEYGGHASAVGASIKPEMIDVASDVFNKTCTEYYIENKIDKTEKINYYEATLKPCSVGPELANSLIETVYPYCQSHNPEPIFRIKDVLIYKAELKLVKEYKILNFYVDGCEYPFKMFTDIYDESVMGKTVDVYFKFPQKWGLVSWDGFSCMCEDINFH